MSQKTSGLFINIRDSKAFRHSQNNPDTSPIIKGHRKGGFSM